MPPLFYKRGIKDNDTVLSLRGALATKQSNARFIGHVVRYASLAMTTSQSMTTSCHCEER